MGYKHLLDIMKLKSAIDVLIRKKVGWDKFDRTGSINKTLFDLPDNKYAGDTVRSGRIHNPVAWSKT